jgi:hypothetical protein
MGEHSTCVSHSGVCAEFLWQTLDTPKQHYPMHYEWCRCGARAKHRYWPLRLHRRYKSNRLFLGTYTSLIVSPYIRLISQYQQLTLDIANPAAPAPLVVVAKPASDTDNTRYSIDWWFNMTWRQSLNLQVFLANFVLQVTTVMPLCLPTTRLCCCQHEAMCHRFDYLSQCRNLNEEREKLGMQRKTKTLKGEVLVI